MKNTALLSQLGALTLAFLVLALGLNAASAQVAPDAPPQKSATPEELNQTELLKAYLQVREQLHTTQLAIVNNRVEAATEKMENLRKAMETERDRQQAELQRAAAEAQRQQAETLRVQRTTIWAAAAFGCAGLLAMVMMPFVQARALKRAIQTAPGTQLIVPPAPDLLAPETAAADQTVATSNQRLLSLVSRMERRIQDLEHTATPAVAAAAPVVAQPLAAKPAVASTMPTPSNGHGVHGIEATRRTAEADRVTWISVLMSKGRSLMSANKPREAITCFEEILQLDPNHAAALVKKGTALERLNRFEEALQSYDRAIELDGRMTVAYLSKGGMCNRLGRYEEAVDAYERALQAEDKTN